MTIKITFSVHNPNPDTIWNKLAEKLSREPTKAEAAAEVRRILSEARYGAHGEPIRTTHHTHTKVQNGRYVDYTPEEAK